MSCDASAMTAAERIAEERGAPELQPISRGGFAADVAGFVSYAIYDRHVDAVGDGVGALNGSPRVVLGLAELGFLRGMPADGRGIKQNLGALQRGQARAFGIPLVPADQRAHATHRGIESAVAEIAGSEVILLVIQRVIGDVHLAIEAALSSVGVEDDGGVVIHAGRALLEDRRDQDDAKLLGQRGQPVGDRAGNGLRPDRTKLESSRWQKYWV